MSGMAERLAEVLAAHVLYGEDGDENYECKCGVIVPTEVMEDAGEHAWHHAHLAEIQAELVEREIAAARGEALREAEVAALTTVTNPWSPDRLGRGICPKCREDKFIGHGPLCWECFAGSGEEGT